MRSSAKSQYWNYFVPGFIWRCINHKKNSEALLRVSAQDGMNEHILRLLMLHLEKMSPPDKLRIINLLNEILKIEPLRSRHFPHVGG